MRTIREQKTNRMFYRTVPKADAHYIHEQKDRDLKDVNCAIRKSRNDAETQKRLRRSYRYHPEPGAGVVKPKGLHNRKLVSIPYYNFQKATLVDPNCSQHQANDEQKILVHRNCCQAISAANPKLSAQ